MPGSPGSSDAAATLAAAFHDGALFRYVQPDPARRGRQLRWLFRRTLDHCRRHGGVLGVDGTTAVAAWVPGEHLAVTPTVLVRTGLLATPVRLGPRATARLQRHERPAERRLRAALTPSTAYLWLLGVRPEAQGTGAGGRALTAVFAAVRAQGADRCLLRTDDAGNVAFYERNGFVVVEHLTALPSGLPAWVMAAPLR